MKNYCPKCLYNMQLSEVKVVGIFRKKFKCKKCKEAYSLSATLMSEDTVRWFVKQQKGQADHLLRGI